MPDKNDLNKKIKDLYQKLSTVRKKTVFIAALGLATSPFAGNKLSAAETTRDNTQVANTLNMNNQQTGESLKNTTQYLGDVVRSLRYDNGNVKYEKYSGGASFFYDENGNLSSESQYGVTRRYDKNQKLASVTLPTGITQKYYENGNLKEEELPYGMRYYNENGSLNHTEFSGEAQVSELGDGSREIVYTDGLGYQKMAKEYQNGSWESYDGFFKKLEMERTADGTYRIYTGGIVSFQYSPSGVATNYDSQGQIESQHIFSSENMNSFNLVQNLNQSQGR